jgi:hypothetical protein
VTRRLLKLIVLAWLGRYLALELASFIGRRRPPSAAPVDSPQPPGWMPGPDVL